MLFTAADILTLEPVKALEQQLTVNSFIVDSVRRVTGISLDQKDVEVKNNIEIKITTSGAKKMVIVLHKEEIERELKERGFSLRL